MPYLTEKFGNASSIHYFGQETRAAVDKARQQVASLINCRPTELVFTSGGTEANNLAIRGLLEAQLKPDIPLHVLTSAIEHPSVSSVCEDLEKRGVRVTYLPVHESRVVRLSDIEAAISDRTKAIIPVHLYGQPADMAPIMATARRQGLVVIEDACQAHGAEYAGRRTGSLGDLACFSFYPGKNLGAYGEGGMVVTGNAEYARTIRMLRDWGAERKYHHVLKGYNYRLEGIQGAVLRVKLRHLDRWTHARRTAADWYRGLLDGSGVQLPDEMSYARHVYHVYAIRSPRRQAWQELLLAQGIQTGIHYPVPVHLQPAFADLGYRAGSFPHAEKAADEVLSLPMYPELAFDQCEIVSRAVRKLATTSQDLVTAGAAA